MTGFNYFKNAIFNHYTDFDGRATRSEYWNYVLVYIMLSFGISVILGITQSTILGILAVVIYLVLLLPSLAVAVRRLHDIGKSGWMLLLGLIPIIGGIIILVFLVKDSESGTNLYGPNPKEIENENIIQENLV